MKSKVIFLLFCTVQANFVFCGKQQTYSDLDANYEKYNNESLASYEIGQVEKDKVTFRLWTSLDQKNYIRLVTGELSNTTQINPGKPLKIIIHGYLSAASNDWVRQITKAYLSTVNANVIEVDWSEPASSVFYPNAAASTKSVAKHLSDLLLDLHKKFKILYPSIHVIGHSLGAHIGGFAGKTIQSEGKGGLGRISGLDPAGPLYTLADPAERLSPDDANFVDVIHTDGNKFGYLNSLGDIDFYPNGGVAWQPGCYIYGVVEMMACSHVRVVKLWLESVNSNKFTANECANIEEYRLGFCKDGRIAIMGEKIDKTLGGNFYLTTNAATPFARNGKI